MKETFHKERELLLKEINTVKNQKNDLEESLLKKSVELSQLKESLNRHHFDSQDSLKQISKVEIQVYIP